jgi:4-diphosphocytidyl-2-C-methyl-D-erythritol kinase
MTSLRAVAPGKVNLCLYLGERREDGLHELVSLVQTVSLGDELTLEPREDGETDQVVCAGVEGPNLAAEALRAYRDASGWTGPPQRLRIDKQVPVAGGMGGGSSDAAVALRLAAHAAGRPDDPLLAELGRRLGADVPALLHPGLKLVEGAGERVTPLPELQLFWLWVIPSPERLATADVYAEADRLALGRSAEELARLRREIELSLRPGGPPPFELMHNDLELAARSLCPSIEDALTALAEAGAQRTLVSGSGPTVVGVFADWDERLAESAAELASRFPGSGAARPVGPELPLPLGGRPPAVLPEADAGETR